MIYGFPSDYPRLRHAGKMPPPEESLDIEGKLYVRVKEATKIMGMERSSIYKEISEGRLPTFKKGRKTFIAMKDIHAWFDELPDK